MVVHGALAADLAIVIVTAAVVGLVANQTGQPTIVAYLLAGLLLGPAALGVITPGEITQTMAELGLAFLLFLLGIEMRIEEIRHLLRPVVRISVPQMILVGLAGAITASLLGFQFHEAALIGAAVAYSSTAIVVKMLTDKDEVSSLPGRIDVGVLLAQDVVVVLLLTLLATGRPDGAFDVATALLTVLGLIVTVGLAAAAASRFLLPGMFRRIADNKDVFFLVAIAWAFLFVLVSAELELSVEMGAFIAGVSIAQLPYSTELRERVAPITDLFVLTFFVSVGLQLTATHLLVHWREAVVASAVLMPVKFLVFSWLVDRQGFGLETTFLASANMLQVSEFALVAGTVAVAGGFVDEAVLGFLSLVAVLTMGASVYVIKYNHQLYERLRPYLRRWETDDQRADDREGYRNHAVVVGYDELTRGLLPRLAALYEDVVVIDRRVDNVELLEAAGYDVVYGDCRHAEIRNSAGLKRADFVLSSSGEPDVNKALLGDVDEGTTVFVEAEWADDASDLYAHGAHYVVMSPQLTAERLAEYLEAYFDDPGAFSAAIEADVARLGGAEPVPETPGRAVGGGDE